MSKVFVVALGAAVAVLAGSSAYAGGFGFVFNGHGSSPGNTAIQHQTPNRGNTPVVVQQKYTNEKSVIVQHGSGNTAIVFQSGYGNSSTSVQR